MQICIDNSLKKIGCEGRERCDLLEKGETHRESGFLFSFLEVGFCV